MRKRVYAGAAAGVAAATVITARQRAARRVTSEDRPANIGFMYAMHAAMRRDLHRMSEASAMLSGGGEIPPNVRAGWSLLKRQLESHRQAEDENLWPALCEHVHNEAQRTEITAMLDEHTLVAAALGAVEDGFAGRQELRHGVDGLAMVVRSHLDHEERSVLPLVAAHLNEREWRRFLLAERARHSRRERIEFLGWVLDDATPEHAAAVFAELPRPARLAYRLVVRRLHDARRLWWVPAGQPEQSAFSAPDHAMARAGA